MPSFTTLSRLSVRQRLTAAVALLASLALLVVGSTLYVLESRRIDRVIEASLTQEIGEFRALQSENDPETRKPFASADRLLTVFLQRNLPDHHEALYGFRDSRAARRTRARATSACSVRRRSGSSSSGSNPPAARAPSPCADRSIASRCSP